MKSIKKRGYYITPAKPYNMRNSDTLILTFDLWDRTLETANMAKRCPIAIIREVLKLIL